MTQLPSTCIDSAVNFIVSARQKAISRVKVGKKHLFVIQMRVRKLAKKSCRHNVIFADANGSILRENRLAAKELYEASNENGRSKDGPYVKAHGLLDGK
jgi:hypothetical protein